MFAEVLRSDSIACAAAEQGPVPFSEQCIGSEVHSEGIFLQLCDPQTPLYVISLIQCDPSLAFFQTWGIP